jgi:hypothetical protein
MVHHREGLPFGLETGNELPCVHTLLDDLYCDSAPNRLLLLGQIDGAHSAFTKNVEQTVVSDFVMAGRVKTFLPVRRRRHLRFRSRTANEKAIRILVLGEQLLDSLSLRWFVSARGPKKLVPFRSWLQFQSSEEDGFLVHR